MGDWMDKYKAIILAAGLGTRLQPLTYAIPKEMIHVCGKPLVQHAVELFRASGIKNIIVIVGEKKGALMDFLKDGSWLGVDISYRFQENRSGNASALFTARPLVDGTFAAAFGDEIIEPKNSLVREMMKKHTDSGAVCTVGLSVVADPKGYGIVKFGMNGKISHIIEKPQTAQELAEVRVGDRYYGMNGVFIFEPEIFDYIQKLQPGRNSEYWIADAIKNMVNDGKTCMAHIHEGIYRDVGTFESLLAVERELLNNADIVNRIKNTS